MENSELLKHIISTLITVSGRKTTETHAVFIMDKVMKKLQNQYDFLRQVNLQDTTFLEDGEPVSIMTNLNSISKKDLREVLYKIISNMNETLGEDAGHFFIKEVAKNVRSDFTSIIKEIGLDFNLMQLENEINEMEKRMINRKK